MQLTVREISALLRVPEKTVVRWIEDQGLPAGEVQGQYRLNRSELVEWATAHHVTIPEAVLRGGEDTEAPQPSLADALRLGGIVRLLPGTDKPEVLRSMVDRMPLPVDADRAFLHQVLLSREKLGSTGIGGGYAIPHARNPIVLDVAGPQVTLCFLERPVDFQALDGKPVHTFFALVSPTVRAHLHMLSRIGYALQRPEFRTLVDQRAPDEDILKAAAVVDQGLEG